MTDRNNNQPNDWRDKLNSLHVSADEAFDRNASWAKLQSRSVKKTKAKRLNWFQLAAAVVLSSIGFIWLIKSADVEKSTLVNNKGVEKVIVPASDNVEKAINTSLHKQPFFIDAKKDDGVDKQKIRALIEKHTTQILKMDTAQMFVNISVPVVDSFVPLVASAPVKKKMKVVHLNELDPAHQNIIAAQESTKPFFPVKFYSRQNYSSNATEVRSGGDQIIKIKLSAQN